MSHVGADPKLGLELSCRQQSKIDLALNSLRKDVRHNHSCRQSLGKPFRKFGSTAFFSELVGGKRKCAARMPDVAVLRNVATHAGEPVAAASGGDVGSLA